MFGRPTTSAKPEARDRTERRRGRRSLALAVVGLAVVLATLALARRRDEGPALEPPF